MDEAKEDQDKLEKLIIRLEKYNAKKGKKKRKEKKSLRIWGKIVLCERRYY